MRVFLTGASGFVGAHSALALLEAGHEVRLLVRQPAPVKAYFTSRGHAVGGDGPVDLTMADMRDTAAVRAAMSGCDGVLHAAATVSLDPRRAQETYETNVQGVRSVIGTAAEVEVRTIIHVSSVSVLFQPKAEVITEATPLTTAGSAYSRSKRDAESYVRELQAQGCPVQISYPSAVVGPDDPKLSAANRGLAQFVSKAPPNTSTGFQIVDVRDLARAHRCLLEDDPPATPAQARYIVGGHYLPWPELGRTLEELTGRRRRSPRVPGSMLRGMGSLADRLRRVFPTEHELGAEAMAYVTQWVPADSGRLVERTGLPFRPVTDTLQDAIRWLAQTGHVRPEHAGTLAG